jgi:hypothetical protein
MYYNGFGVILWATICCYFFLRVWGQYDVGPVSSAACGARCLPQGIRPRRREYYREPEGYGSQIETYARDHTVADFCHGIYPEFANVLSTDLDLEKNDVVSVPHLSGVFRLRFF